MNKVSCYQCGKTVKLENKISFREECPHCSTDLHICFNCRFYDKSAYNECRESSAEKVKEKGKNNYCEYFESLCKENNLSGLSGREAQLKAAEALFKKD